LIDERESEQFQLHSLNSNEKQKELEENSLIVSPQRVPLSLLSNNGNQPVVITPQKGNISQKKRPLSDINDNGNDTSNIDGDSFEKENIMIRPGIYCY